MRRALAWSVLLWAWVALGPPFPGGASSADPVRPILTAVIRNFCFEVYWWGRLYRGGGPRPAEVKTDGEGFYVWVRGVPEVWTSKQEERRFEVELFYRGRLKAGEAAVIETRDYYTSPPAGVPRSPLYFVDRRHFESSEVIKTGVVFPRDCTPGYDPPTPQKERMLEAVVNTLRIQLTSFVRKGIAQYLPQVTLVIADFNVDYPQTHILVEPNTEVYTVTLHDPQDYDSDRYEREGEYPFGQVHEPQKDLLRKIRKHGIIRKIPLAP